MITLRNGQLTTNQIEQMTEIHQRQFKGETLTSICKDLGIDRKTFYRRRQSTQWQEFEKELNEKLLENSYHEIMNTVVLKAKQGSHPHAKLYLEATGRLKSSRELREEEEKRRTSGSTSPLDISELRRMFEEDKKLRLVE